VTGRQQVEELLRRADRRVGPTIESIAGPPTRGELADQHPGVEYFELAESLFRTARKEVLLVNGQMNGFPREDIDRFRDRIAALGERSIAVSVICHPDELDGHGRQEFLQRIGREHGVQTRISTVDLHGMLVIDRRRALMWPAKHGRNCLLVHSPVIIEPLLTLLDASWDGACDLETFVRYHQNILDEKTPQILRLLGSGRKDEVAARQLGVSVRTYRRHVASLMEMLGAESRFEAGVKAAVLGLIDVDVRGGTPRPAAPPGRGAVPVVPSQRSGLGSGAAPEVGGDREPAGEQLGCAGASLAQRRPRRDGSSTAPWAARWCPR
jgi:hypothetical protein